MAATKPLEERKRKMSAAASLNLQRGALDGAAEVKQSNRGGIESSLRSPQSVSGGGRIQAAALEPEILFSKKNLSKKWKNTSIYYDPFAADSTVDSDFSKLQTNQKVVTK